MFTELEPGRSKLLSSDINDTTNEISRQEGNRRPLLSAFARGLLIPAVALLGSYVIAPTASGQTEQDQNQEEFVDPEQLRQEAGVGKAEVLGEQTFANSGDAIDITNVIAANVNPSSEQLVQELTPHQRVVNNLRGFYASLRNPSVFTPWNPAEVEASANNPDQRVFETFIIEPGPNNEPRLFILIGGESGLSLSLGNITSVKEAIRLINLYDPEMIPLLTSDEYGFRGISGMYFKAEPGAATTYDPRRGMVLINEEANPRDRFLPGAMVAFLLAEARVNYTSRSSVVINGRTILTVENKLDDNPGIDKNLWARRWGEKHQHLFDENAYASFMGVINKGSEYYSSHWP